VKLYDLLFNLLLSTSGIILAGINLWNFKKFKNQSIEIEVLKLKLKECERAGTK
jgi:hypothetical protein